MESKCAIKSSPIFESNTTNNCILNEVRDYSHLEELLKQNNELLPGSNFALLPSPYFIFTLSKACFKTYRTTRVKLMLNYALVNCVDYIVLS